MKYNFGKKFQLHKELGDSELKYQPVDFMVLDADSPEEAEKAVQEWKDNYVKEELARMAEIPFEDEGDVTCGIGKSRNEYLKSDKK